MALFKRPGGVDEYFRPGGVDQYLRPDANLDTAEKRFSMINFGTDDNHIMFEVDSAVDLDDRQHLLGCYSGIAFNDVGGGGLGIPIAAYHHYHHNMT